MFTKQQNSNTSAERVHESDKSIHEEIERLKAEIKRADELAEYRLKLLMQMPEHPLDIYERAYLDGRQDGIDEALAQYEKKWVGLTDKDFKYQQPAEVLTMKYTEALLKERNI